MTTASRQPSLRSQAHLQGSQNQQHKSQPCKRACLHPRYPNYFSFFSFILLSLGLTTSFGQSINRNAIFKRQTLSQLQQQNPTPKQSEYQAITTTPVIINNYNPILGNNSVEQQNRIILQQRGMLPGENSRQQEWERAKHEMKEDEIKENQEQLLAMSKPFQNSFQEFLQMNPDSFSVSKAVYLSESAWYDNAPTYKQFIDAVKTRANLAKQILKTEGLKSNNNTAINYAIQKLFAFDNKFINPKTKQLVTVPKLGYDFNDFMGEKNWSNMFVTKLLATGKGQCHSLPLLYLCMAEQLGGKAYLSLSPEHSFIQYFDEKGYRYNFETTNGNLVTQTWLMQSNYINATALKNKTYLDTLSNRNLYAQLLSDLLQNYIEKVGYNQTSQQITNQILTIDPNNLAALMVQANFNTFIAKRELKQVGNPPVEQIPNYPTASTAYQKMLQSYQQIEETGFQDIPKEAYELWLKSVEQEKKKQENKQIQQRQKAEIEMLKKLKTKITFTPKG